MTPPVTVLLAVARQAARQAGEHVLAQLGRRRFTGADKDNNGAASFRFFNRIVEIAQRPRVMGSAALDICWVAAGRTDAYFEPGVFIWDVAAASLILACAGGRCEVLRRGSGYKMAVLATNGRLHQPLRDAIAPLLA